VALGELLARGFFPKELPSPFVTVPFANVLSAGAHLPGDFAKSAAKGNNLPTAKVGRYSLARGAGGHFAGEEFGDGGVHAEACDALEMTEGEERSLHSGRDDGSGKEERGPLARPFRVSLCFEPQNGHFPSRSADQRWRAGPVTSLERSRVSATECPLLLTVYKSGATVL
jgi:hypothetical protein